MFTYGDILGAQNFNVTDDGDILITGRIDQGSTVTLISNTGSVTITGKIDGGSKVTLAAPNGFAGNISIGTTGDDGDKKIDGGSIVSMNAGNGISIGDKIDNGSTRVWLKAGFGIDITGKIDGGAIVHMSTVNGTIHIHDKISNDATYVTYWPQNSLIVDGGIEGHPVVIAAPS